MVLLQARRDCTGESGGILFVLTNQEGNQRLFRTDLCELKVGVSVVPLGGDVLEG